MYEISVSFIDAFDYQNSGRKVLSTINIESINDRALKLIFDNM